MLGTRIRVIRAGVLIDGTGTAAIRDALVVADEAGRIVYAGSATGAEAPDVATFAPDQVLSAAEGTVFPGFIDTHVHLTFGTNTDVARAAGGGERRTGHQVTDEQVAQIKADGEATRALRAIQAAQACLTAGITTVRDCGAKGQALYALRDLIERGLLVGPRVQVSGAPITTRAGHCWWLGGEADTLDEAVAAVRTRVRDGADFIKVMATGGGMTHGSNTVRAQYPAETLRAIADDAHRLYRLVTAHAHGVEGIERCIEAGIDMIEHCSWTTPEGPRLDPRVAEALAAAGTYVGDTSAGSGGQAARRGLTFDDLPASTRARYALFARLRELGVRVVTSSDAMYPKKPFEDFAWGIVASALYGGLSAEQAVHAATGLAARAMGREPEYGVLAPGRRADLAIVDGDATADSRSLARIRWVLRDGVVLATGAAVWNAGLRGW